MLCFNYWTPVVPPIPSHISSLKTSEYSANGILSTTFNTSASDAVLSVGIVFNTWPSWTYVLNHRMFRILWILCCNDKEVAFLESHFKSVPCIKSIYDLDLTFEAVDVLAFNGPLSGLQTPPPCASICLFDYKFRPRKLWQDWSVKIGHFSHAQVGGCSSHDGFYSVAVRNSGPYSLPDTLCHEAPAIVLGSVLKCTQSGAVVQGPPPELNRTPSLGEIITLGRNIFHHKGYFPFDTFDAKFVVPSVFSSSRWVRRALSLAELRDVFDIPQSVYHISKNILSLMSSPLKSLYSVVFCAFFKNTKTGGDSSLPKSIDHLQSAEDYCIKSKEDTNWILNERHSKKESAVQHDDARVPVEYWNESLERDLGHKLSKEACSALEILRKALLRKWKRSVTKCFVSWMKCKNCHENHCKNLFEKRFNSKSMLNEVCSECSIRKSRQEGNIVIFVGDKYHWCVNGRSRYKRFRHILLRSDTAEGKEMEESRVAGIDCLSRASQCTVWVWKGGSRPFSGVGERTFG